MNTHPVDQTKPGDLFVVMIQVGTVKGQPAFEALGYGLPGQPSPEMLLRRGSRCTGFPTEFLARKAMKESAEAWKSAGITFHHGRQVLIQKVETSIPHPVESNRWYAVCAGGTKRTAFVDGAWIVPMFNDHDACRNWWHSYCRRTNEHSVWGITEGKP